MAKLFAKKFYQSKAWKDTRQLVLCNNNFSCEICGNVEHLIIHHKIELNERNIHDPNIALGLENLMCVCHECHNKIHATNNQRIILFDENGNISKVVN